MSKVIELPFGGELRRFRLQLGELRELQDKCQVGPATILSRLIAFQPQATDTMRPRAENFPLGLADPDYIAQFNLFSVLRSLGGDWRIDDVREPIRLGLIGAGTTPTEAYILVSRYVDNVPLTECIGVASEILMHALVGEANDPVGKPVTEKATRRKKATA
jgi:hypothetical protein